MTPMLLPVCSFEKAVYFDEELWSNTFSEVAIHSVVL